MLCNYFPLYPCSKSRTNCPNLEGIIYMETDYSDWSALFCFFFFICIKNMRCHYGAFWFLCNCPGQRFFTSSPLNKWCPRPEPWHLPVGLPEVLLQCLLLIYLLCITQRNMAVVAVLVFCFGPLVLPWTTCICLYMYFSMYVNRQVCFMHIYMYVYVYKDAVECNLT